MPSALRGLVEPRLVRGRPCAALGPPAARYLGRLELTRARTRRLGALGALVALVGVAFAGSPAPDVAAPALAAAHAAGAAAAGAAHTKPSGARFELGRAEVEPRRAFFDAGRPIRLRYRFSARRRLDLVIRVVRVADRKTVRRWVEHGLAPGRAHVRRWDGRRGDRGVPADGRYELRVGPRGHRGALAGRFDFHDHRFPVAGPHGYGDRFGDPRSGGRVHEGQDLPSPCGTPLVAARGGRVQARGYSDALYGHWVLIDGTATGRDYFYAHLQAPSPLEDGERVRTGEPVGAVGMTGNARSEFCQLHFELWPHGYRHGAAADPAPDLRAWDAFS
ncbi:MAG: peptidoglycan DD-metalloendopeptidase family protein [Solirubrobacterales bacterium]|nr:peptidoglycan DD-metalloendopeptidase family protein [Solirubrobacterales bacterium]